MRGKVRIEDEGGERAVRNQMKDEAVETAGVRAITIRFLNRFTGHVSCVDVEFIGRYR